MHSRGFCELCFGLLWESDADLLIVFPRAGQGGKKIQIESLTHIQNSLTCCLTDRQRPGQRIRTGIIEAIGGKSWGLALEDCFLIAANCDRIHVKLGLLYTSGRWEVGGVDCSLEDSGHRRPLVLIAQVKQNQFMTGVLDQQPVSPPPYFQYNCVKCMTQTDKKNKTNTSSASKLMKLAIAKPSMTSSSQDTDSLFLRRGGLCLPNPGRHSLPPGPRTLLVPHASRSEPEDRDVARSPARSTLLLRRSLSR